MLAQVECYDCFEIIKQGETDDLDKFYNDHCFERKCHVCGGVCVMTTLDPVIYSEKELADCPF